MLSVLILSVLMLSALMLSALMRIDVMLSDVAHSTAIDGYQVELNVTIMTVDVLSAVMLTVNQFIGG
jgi:hypothetical protein